MASYLITFVGADKRFVPNVLLYGALFGAVAAYVMGLLSDRFGRRRMFLVARTVPETVDRDLQILTDAQPGEARPGLTEAEQLRGHKVVTPADASSRSSCAPPRASMPSAAGRRAGAARRGGLRAGRRAGRQPFQPCPPSAAAGWSTPTSCAANAGTR
jgi:hypothetical protein